MRPIRLRTWLMLGYSAVLALATLGLGMGLVTVLGLAATSERMVEENFRAVDLGSQLRRLMSANQLLVARRLGEDGAALEPLMRSFESEARTLLAQARERRGGDADATVLDRADAAVDELVAVVRRVDAQRRLEAQTRAASSEPSPAASEEFPGEVATAFESLRAATLDFYAHHQDAMRERGNRIRRQSERLAVAIGLLGAFTVLVGVLVSLRLARRLSTPMERLALAAERVASGDFEVQVGRSGVREADLVAQRFDEMTAALARFHAINLDRILAESRRLDQVVASIEEGLVILDDHGRIERANPSACALLELDADLARGHALEAQGALAPLRAAVDAVLTAPRGQLDSRAGDLALGDGDAQRTVAWSLRPFSESARFGLILALRDVTAARLFERMRTDFVLRASHELRTPITGMRMAFGLLDVKLAFAPDSREAELAATLRDEMQRLVGLINALLDLSRLYAGSYALQRAPLAPDELLQRARQRFAPMAEHAGIALQLEIDPELPSLHADVGALDRVLDNLVGNALRHTPRGGEIAFGAAMRDGALELWVRDSGEGIAHADRGRVFEPFVQIGTRVGGVGLGLAMCREIVRQHGGSIRLDSAPGRGSCFTLRLPA